jgi:hypothetical protein
LHHLASYWSLEEARAKQYFLAKDKEKEIKVLAAQEPSKTKAKEVRRLESEKAKHFDEYLNLSDSQGLVQASLEKIIFKAEELPPVKAQEKKNPKTETLANGMLVLEKREIGTGPNGTNRDFWKDITTGLIWGPVEDFEKVKALQEKMNLTVKYDGKEYPDYVRAAEEYCKILEMELPSQKDFLDALRNPGSEKGTDKGFGYGQNIALKDNLPDMKDRWFWSSSPHPVNAQAALSFGGFDGEVYFGFRNSQAPFVRCVSR